MTNTIKIKNFGYDSDMNDTYQIENERLNVLIDGKSEVFEWFNGDDWVLKYRNNNYPFTIEVDFSQVPYENDAPDDIDEIDVNDYWCKMSPNEFLEYINNPDVIVRFDRYNYYCGSWNETIELEEN